MLPSQVSPLHSDSELSCRLTARASHAGQTCRPWVVGVDNQPPATTAGDSEITAANLFTNKNLKNSDSEPIESHASAELYTSYSAHAKHRAIAMTTSVRNKSRLGCENRIFAHIASNKIGRPQETSVYTAQNARQPAIWI